MYEVDNLVIGGGIFGCHAALALSKTGTTMIVEAKSSIMDKTTRWNHGRVHTGLHYLNSYETARQANDGYQKFVSDNASAINNSFKHIYAIDKFESKSNSDTFEMLANSFNIEYSKTDIKILKHENLESAYMLDEPTYDILELKRIYLSRLDKNNIKIFTNSTIVGAEIVDERYVLEVLSNGNIMKVIVNKNIFVAVYDQTNDVLKALGLPSEDITYVLGRQAYAHIPELSGLGIMVVDGPFVSTSPFGFSGLHALNASRHNNFIYTNDIDEVRNFEDPSDSELYDGIIAQMSKYINVNDVYLHSTKRYVRTLFNYSKNPESRETTIKMISSSPRVYAALSGKVSNIYEIDRITLD